MSEHAAHNEGGDVVYAQYETIEQQQESYVVGMWSFLVTEIMFFGGLFMVYSLYRWKYVDVWSKMSTELDWRWGGLNTTILLISSFFVAMAVQKAQKRETKAQINYLWLTVLCALGFLCVKYVEYQAKFHHGLWPDALYTAPHIIPHGEEGYSRIFMSLYFAMTGLHGAHVAIGIIVITTLIFMTKAKAPSVSDFVPTEMVGLYWHFVDLVWIFLYPLFYLIPK
ncbi:MAG TPA: cytochrome c oxidase subunit 3 family protein [Fimbriimonadaceae bacterium]|nr:cytochrome c oxidase subunit 3 family protein [Fimbriimonadaceae bacterium]